MAMTTKSKRTWLGVLGTLILIIALLGLGTTLLPNGDAVEPQPPTETETETADSLPTPEADGLPHDQLFITVERQQYEDGDLRLTIPKLTLELPVLAGVDAATLKRGIGLYDYAQLPGEGNRNVSIAGHRNNRLNGQVTDDAPFYYIDQLTDGDRLYLTDADLIYVYEYDQTTIVASDDWGPIYSQGFSCLTLTSCHPIGTTDRRIIVRARLVDILPRTADYEYPSAATT